MNSKSKLFSGLFLLMIAISSCKDDAPVTPTADYSAILTNVTNHVIVDTYVALDQNAQAMVAASNTLQANPTEANLLSARAAWVAARQPWEQSEGFLFGPVDTEGIDPAIDSWPVNKVDLENVLASSDILTPSYVQSLEGTLKGFHTIEFLLWGGNSEKTIGEFTTREFEYLAATSAIFSSDAGKLASAWVPSGQNFAKNVIEAGLPGSIYISQKAALEELANGILGIADEVGNGKIHDPLEQEDFSLEESQFSNNSKSDFTDNIRSIQNIYLGINGDGLTTIVSEKNAPLDVKIRMEIQAAIDAIQAIPGTFTEAIPANSPSRPAAEFAQETVRTLQQTFEEGLIPLISGL